MTDEDTELARALFAERRHDVARLQALLAEARTSRAAGGPGLAPLLVERGLLRPDELAALRTRLGLAEPAAAAAPPVSPAAVDRVGEYRVLRVLGAGGMGQVVLGEHVVSGARHAVKLFQGGRAEQAVRFAREGQAQAQVDGHPNVVKVFGAGQDGGRAWLAIELCEGGDLAARLEAGPLPPAEAVRVVAAVARGVAHAHARGVLHRDLKPSNVVFDAAGTPKVLDFGLARVVGAETLTKTGALLGTPAYMAPEQARGQGHDADARTDVYGLGAVLYHCLTGRPPFEGGGMGILAAVLRETPTAPRALRPEVPAWLDAVCRRAMAREPGERFDSAAALVAALAAGPAGATRSRRWPRALAALLVVVVAAGGGVAAAVVARLRTEEAQAAALARLGPGAEALVRDAWAAALRPLDEAGAAAAVARERRRGLAEEARRCAPGVQLPERALAEGDALADGLEGLAALRAGDAARAGARAAALLVDVPDGLDAGRPEAAGVSTRALVLRRALRGALAAEDGDPAAALADLQTALAAGVGGGVEAGPSGLRPWASAARLRLAQAALSAGRPADAVAAIATAAHLVADLPAERRARVADVARQAASAPLAELARVQPNAAYDADALGPLVQLLTVVVALDPGAGLLAGAEAALLDELAFDPVRALAEPAALLAAATPGDLALQARAGLHGANVVWVEIGARHKRDVAADYLAAVERALAGPDAGGASRGDLELQRVELLLRVLRDADASAAVEALLATRDLEPAQRAQALYWRATVAFEAERFPDARAALDEVLAIDPGHAMAYWKRARSRWAPRSRTLKDAAGALEDALTYCARVEGRLRKHRWFFKQAALSAWLAAGSLGKVERALPALEQLAEYFPDPSHAGWRVRLAQAVLRAGDEARARTLLAEAGPVFARDARLRDLAPAVRAAAVQADAKALAKELDALVKALEARRKPQDSTP